MPFWVTTVIYFLYVRGCQVWLGVVYRAHLLEDIYRVKIDRFTKWDRDRLTKLESVYTIQLLILDTLFIFILGECINVDFKQYFFHSNKAFITIAKMYFAYDKKFTRHLHKSIVWKCRTRLAYNWLLKNVSFYTKYPEQNFVSVTKA